MAVRVSGVRGLAEAQRALKQLPEKLQGRVMIAAVRNAASLLRTEIRKAAPRGQTQSDASKRYGRLRQNVRLVRLKRVPKGSAAFRVNTGNAFWGVFYEFGTSRQPARPWFRPAIETASDAALDRLRVRLAEGIAKEAEKLAAAGDRLRRR